MKKVFLGPLREHSYLVPILYPNFGRKKERPNRLFLGNTFIFFTEPVVRIVDTIDEADYILLPHHESVYPQDELGALAALSRKSGRPILTFREGDSTQHSKIPGAVTFRISQYKDELLPSEIMSPPFAEDLLVGKTFQPRMRGDVPIVGFCGQAAFTNVRREIRAHLKNLFYKTLSPFCLKDCLARQNGVLLRRRAIERLRRDPSVHTNFIIRRSFSRNATTIELDPAQAHKEFVDNLINSDLCLAVRGSGNASLRFYEALSLGRVPLFIDTSIPLPLEQIIDYDTFMVRVPVAEIDDIGASVRDFWRHLKPDRFLEMQRRARETFERYLRVDAFYTYLFKGDNLEQLLRSQGYRRP